MDDNIQKIKFEWRRRWQFVLPTCLSLLAVLISLAALIVALSLWHHHNQHTGGTGVGKPTNLGTTSSLQIRKGPPFSPSLDNAELSSRLEKLWSEVAMLTSVVSTLEPSIMADLSNSSIRFERGSTYVHWGRSECNGDAELVYSGFAAGSPTATERMSGGGVQYLCLPNQPEYNRFDMSNDTLAFGWIYGAEYMSSKTKIFPDEMHGQNVPCGVCHSPRSAHMLLPARRTCPDTWTMEYEGYLMSSYITNQRATFECVDHMPEGINGTEGIDGGALFYHIAGYCQGPGSLQRCPPYVHARELTCAICTK
ncbi:uncharacterized protein [Watersipora subatra]